jgi:hypothetical protein
MNFLSAGLVGMNVVVGDRGVTASYSYSNEVLRVPEPMNDITNIQQKMRNSWMRQYRPNEVIS